MTGTYAVVFWCKHRAILLDEEYGDGSAWCQQCGAFRCYDDRPGVTGDPPTCLCVDLPHWPLADCPVHGIPGRRVTGDTPTNRYGHGHGCVCPLCSQTVTSEGVTGDTPSPLDVLRDYIDGGGYVIKLMSDGHQSAVPADDAKARAALAQVEALTEAAQAVWDRGGHPHQLDQLHAALVPFAAHKDTA